MKPTCKDCGGPMPPKGQRFRNVCTKEGEFPFCSDACARHSYWQTDLHIFFDEFDKKLAKPKRTNNAK